MCYKNNRSSLILFAEDPGAFNYFAPLSRQLSVEKIPHTFFSSQQRTINYLNWEIYTQKFSLQKLKNSEKKVRGVVLGTSENLNSPSFEITLWARKMGIPSAGLIDSGINAAYRFRGDSESALAFAPDFLLVPDQWSKSEFISLMYPSNKINVIGQPFQSLKVPSESKEELRLRLFPQEVLDRFVITFISELSDGLNGPQFKRNESFTLHGRGNKIGRTEIVIEELIDAINSYAEFTSVKPYLVIRLHPKESPGRFGELLQEFDQVDGSRESPMPLVKASDLVVGMTSMLLNEAWWSGQRCLSIVPRKVEASWLPAVRAGAIPSVWERERLRLILEEMLTGRIRGLRGLSKDSIELFSPEKTVRLLNRLFESW